MLLCGSWTVKGDVDIIKEGIFEMNGSFIVGNNNSQKKITVKENATFRVEGNLTIYGDLVLENDAKLEFVGAASSVYVTGKVTIKDSASVSGNFTDVLNKF